MIIRSGRHVQSRYAELLPNNMMRIFALLLITFKGERYFNWPFYSETIVSIGVFRSTMQYRKYYWWWNLKESDTLNILWKEGCLNNGWSRCLGMWEIGRFPEIIIIWRIQSMPDSLKISWSYLKSFYGVKYLKSVICRLNENE